MEYGIRLCLLYAKLARALIHWNSLSGRLFFRHIISDYEMTNYNTIIGITNTGFFKSARVLFFKLMTQYQSYN